MIIEELNLDKASKLLGKIDTVVIPIGTMESHGPHCSVVTDSLVAEWMAKDVDKIIGDKIYVAPTIVYGHTWHFKHIPGSHDISGRVLSDFVFEVINGFRPWKVKYA